MSVQCLYNLFICLARDYDGHLSDEINDKQMNNDVVETAPCRREPLCYEGDPNLHENLQ